MTLTLLDDGAVLKRSRGLRDVHVTYAVPGGGESYYLKVGGAPGAFSLFFGEPSIA